MITKNDIKNIFHKEAPLIDEKTCQNINELIKQDERLATKNKNGKYRLRLDTIFNNDLLKNTLSYLYLYETFRKQKISTISARPGHGSFSFLLNFCCEVSLKKEHVLYISTDSTLNSIATKLKENYSLDVMYHNHHISFESTVHESTIEGLKKKIEYTINKKDIKLICIERVESIVEDRKSDLENFLNHLYAISKAHGVPIIIGHRLNRKIDFREEKRPVYEDLDRQIKRISNYHLFLYRDIVYNPNIVKQDQLEIDVWYDRKKEAEILKNYR